MVIMALGRHNISPTIFSVREINCPCTTKSIVSKVYRMIPSSHSFTNGQIRVSRMLRKLKTLTYIAQWASLPHPSFRLIHFGKDYLASISQKSLPLCPSFSLLQPHNPISIIGFLILVENSQRLSPFFS